MSEVTGLLHRARDGDDAALGELMPLVYQELRRIARAFMRHQSPGHSLQPTALVNEAFVKLLQGGQPRLEDRAHLLALMSRVMRQVLVDHARTRGAAKRGGDELRVPLDTNIQLRGQSVSQQLGVLDLHRVLTLLELQEPALAQVVEMYYFGGMTAEEAAVAAGRSAHIVRHQLRAARAWLRRELAREA